MSTTPSTKSPPEGFTIYKEGQAEVLVAQDRDVFVNPIQEFNRDLSVLAIRAWSELTNEERRLKREQKLAHKAAAAENKSKGKKRKIEEVETPSAEAEAGKETSQQVEPAAPAPIPAFVPRGFSLFEGLAATGVRSIRYAKEIPLLRYIQANDLSAAAADNIRRNLDWNELVQNPSTSATMAVDSETATKEEEAATTSEVKPPVGLKMHVSQGDCCSVLYAHRVGDKRFDIIDLDPYGTAAPFIDGAVQAVNDGGLLCVTCTDLAVLAGSNYPEKCFSNYGGTPIKAEYTHEGALRILLQTLATSAARYGRHIEPLLSLSIDYYIRVFVRVRTGPQEVKKLASRLATTYVCHQCQAFHLQQLGRETEKKNEIKGTTNYKYNLATGPPIGQHCSECNGAFAMSGPLWIGSLHNSAFVERMLADGGRETMGTAARLSGMLKVAQSELDCPFYFTPARIASLFQTTCPPLSKVASALVNSGHKVSRSHACAGSIKTDAPINLIHDVMRKWIEDNPVKMENIKDGSPAKTLLAKSAQHTIDLSSNAVADKAMLTNVKIVRYQQNPTVNWGPQSRAKQAKQS